MRIRFFIDPESRTVCAYYMHFEVCKNVDAPKLFNYLIANGYGELAITSIRRWYSAAKGRRHVLAISEERALRSGKKLLDSVGREEILKIARACRALASELRRTIVEEARKNIENAIFVFEPYDAFALRRMVSRMYTCEIEHKDIAFIVAKSKRNLMIAIADDWRGYAIATMIPLWAIERSKIPEAVAVAMQKLLSEARSKKINIDLRDVIDIIADCVKDLEIPEVRESIDAIKALVYMVE